MSDEYTAGFEDLIDTTPKPDTFPYPVDDRAGWRIARSIGHLVNEHGHDVTRYDNQTFWMLYGLAMAYTDAYPEVETLGYGTRHNITYRFQEVVDSAIQRDETCRAWLARTDLTRSKESPR